MKTNPQLRPLILGIVDNQLNANNPPQTRQTLERLLKEGYSEKEAKELIACVVVSDMFDMLKKNEQHNPAKYAALLAQLPRLPE